MQPHGSRPARQGPVPACKNGGGNRPKVATFPGTDNHNPGPNGDEPATLN